MVAGGAPRRRLSRGRVARQRQLHAHGQGTQPDRGRRLARSRHCPRQRPPWPYPALEPAARCPPTGRRGIDGAFPWLDRWPAPGRCLAFAPAARTDPVGPAMGDAALVGGLGLVVAGPAVSPATIPGLSVRAGTTGPSCLDPAAVRLCPWHPDPRPAVKRVVLGRRPGLAPGLDGVGQHRGIAGRRPGPVTIFSALAPP